MDDGSPENASAIRDESSVMDDGITVLQKGNEGVSAARNDGLAMAGAEWVICCDSDDWMEEDALESLYKAGIEKNADVVIADIFRINGHERSYCALFDNEFEFTDPDAIKKVVLSVVYQRYCPMTQKQPQFGLGGPWNKAARRNLIAEHGLYFDTDLMGVYDDRLFVANAYVNAKKIAYLHKAIYNYVLVEDSITRSYKANILEVNENIFGKFREFIEAHYAGDPAVEGAYNAMIVNRLHAALRLYFFSGKNPDKWSDKRKKLKRVLETEPYNTAIARVGTSMLHDHLAYAVKVMKMNPPEALRLLFKMKELKGKVKK